MTTINEDNDVISDAIGGIGDREDIIDMLEKAFRPRSGTGIAFVSDRGFAGYDVLYADGYDEFAYGVLCHVDLGVEDQSLVECVAKAHKKDPIDYSYEHDEMNLVADAVGAYMCGNAEIPGIHIEECIIAPVLVSCRKFASMHSVDDIISVPIKISRNISRHYGKMTGKYKKSDRSRNSKENKRTRNTGTRDANAIDATVLEQR